MKLLLLAAGEGRRLKEVNKVKPLTRLFGLTLLERAIKTAEKAGISDIFLVLGANAEEIIEFVKKRNLNVTIVFNKDWPRGNGSSVCAAKNYVSSDEEFLIAMADHLSDGLHLRKLIDEKMNSCSLLLAVDPERKEYIDLEDATKVLYDEKTGLILNAGKELKQFNAIDTGFFKANGEIFKALEETKEDGSLTAALNWLAKQGKAKAVVVKDAFWIDIDTKEALRKAKKLLLSQLPKTTDGPVSKYLNRLFSIPLSAFLSNTKITPNLISVFSFLLALASSVLFSLGKTQTTIAAGILTQLSSIIDGCDGEVARLKLQESEFGGWFDAVLDRIADGLILLGITAGLIKTGVNPLTATLALGASLIGSYILSYTADKYDYFLKKGLIKGIRLGRDLRLFLIFLGGVFNFLLHTLFLIGFLSFVETVRRISVAYRLSKKEV